MRPVYLVGGTWGPDGHVKILGTVGLDCWTLGTMKGESRPRVTYEAVEFEIEPETHQSF
jgi:hypothetical protein